MPLGMGQCLLLGKNNGLNRSLKDSIFNHKHSQSKNPKPKLQAGLLGIEMERWVFTKITLKEIPQGSFGLHLVVCLLTKNLSQTSNGKLGLWKLR